MSKRGREEALEQLKSQRVAGKFSALTLTSADSGLQQTVAHIRDPGLKPIGETQDADVGEVKTEKPEDGKQRRIEGKTAEFERVAREEELEVKDLDEALREYQRALIGLKAADDEIAAIYRQKKERELQDEESYRREKDRLDRASEELAGLQRKLDSVREANRKLAERDSVLAAKATDTERRQESLLVDSHRLEASLAACQEQEAVLTSEIRQRLSDTEAISHKLSEDAESIEFLQSEIANYKQT